MIGAQMHQRCSRPVHRQRITSRCPCVCVCAPCMVRVVVAPSFSALHLAVAPSCHGMAWHGIHLHCIAMQPAYLSHRTSTRMRTCMHSTTRRRRARRGQHWALWKPEPGKPCCARRPPAVAAHVRALLLHAVATTDRSRLEQCKYNNWL